MAQPFADLTAEPTTWPAPRSDYYGVQVWEDEDGEDLVMDGHPPRRRLLAAANLFAREQWGRVNLLDGEVEPGDVERYVRVRRLWWNPEAARWVTEGTPGAQAMTLVQL